MATFSKKEKKDKKLKKKQIHYYGFYNDIEYFSCLELATILYCEEKGFRIKNCTLGPVEYFDPQKQKIRKYYPDFLVDNFLILEIKWLGFIYEKKKEEIHAKKDSLEKFCEKNDYGCLFVTNNMIKKKYLEKAKRIHNDTFRKRKEIQNSRKNSRNRRDK